MNKRCSKCGDIKPFGEFYKDRSKPDGLQYKCKSCTREHYKKPKKEYDRKYRSLNKERINEYMRKYRLLNKEQIKECDRKYNLLNKELRKEYKRKYSLLNRERINKYKRKYINELADCYIRKLILNSSPILFAKDIPIELIEAKRLYLQTYRQLKEIKS